MLKFGLLAVLFFSVCTFSSTEVWASPFSLPVGEKKLVFPERPEVLWSPFCGDKPLGCARFQVRENKNVSFGLMKSLSSKMAKEHFKKYCDEVFELTKKSDPAVKKFVYKTAKALDYCQWEGEGDMVYFFLKEGLLLNVTVSGQWDVSKMVNEAKVHEKK